MDVILLFDQYLLVKQQNDTYIMFYILDANVEENSLSASSPVGTPGV